jgi:hypothetical protein
LCNKIGHWLATAAQPCSLLADSLKTPSFMSTTLVRRTSMLMFQMMSVAIRICLSTYNANGGVCTSTHVPVAWASIRTVIYW